jgi:hypothetical protein
MRLTATFSTPLKAAIVLRGDGSPRSYSTKNGDFDIILAIAPVEGARSKKKNERLWTYMADELSVSVTRDEATRPPDVLAVPGGGRDLTPRVPYFESRVRAYREAALDVLNNAISFLRYELHQPLLRSIGERSGQLSSPVWTDDEGQEIDPGVRTIVVRAVRGERSELGVVKFEAKHHKPFRAALTKSRPPRLYEEILSDAQAAAFDGNIRRAVLELAIACEVFVKHAFLGGGGNTALVYEALEDKGKVNARVLDLIEIGGTARLGKTFRAVDKDAYTDIDHLFRARNKIAHRGEAAFRDDAGRLHTVDSKLLERWWRSTQRLFAWAG